MAGDWGIWACATGVVRRLATPHLRVGDGEIRRMVGSGLRRNTNRRKERGGTRWTHLGPRWSLEILAATEAVSRQGRATRNAVGWRSRRGWCRRRQRQRQTERERRRRRHRETAGGGWALPLSLTRGRPSHSHCAVPSRRGAWALGTRVLSAILLFRAARRDDGCQGGAALGCLLACLPPRLTRGRWAVGGPGLCRCAGCTARDPGHQGAVGCGIGAPSSDSRLARPPGRWAAGPQDDLNGDARRWRLALLAFPASAGFVCRPIQVMRTRTLTRRWKFNGAGRIPPRAWLGSVAKLDEVRARGGAGCR